MSNEPKFLDASGWIALLNRTESSHVEANRIWREWGSRRTIVYVTDWIAAEAGNGLARSRSRDLFAPSLRIFMTAANVRLIFVDGELLGKALDLYEARRDKGWGLVDCASFVVMMQRGIRDAITGDRHFEQAGFRCLLSDPGRKGGTSNGPLP